MKCHYYIIFCLALFVSCDDGDIFTVDLEFDELLERCDNFEDSYLVYDTREDPNEALLLVLPKPSSDYLFTTATETSVELTIPGEVQFYYRKYNTTLSDGVLCNVLSDSGLVVTEDNVASAGTVVVSVNIEDDDNDGIPSEFEYGPGGIADPQDWDGDGIADYLDEDDDNDNVKTINEIDNSDSDDNPNTNPLDTDGDGDLDYLDTDDDGDGIDTRLEDENENENPRDDYQESTDGSVVPRRYLDANASEAFTDSGFIDNTYTRIATTRFLVLNTGIGPINSTEIPFGTYIGDPISFNTEID
ncbi:hypothetical protein [Winogradskyella sp. PG-2]|uniref:hypothetical protein n=1 Tax=Winogradskyella sp. PG-2 TaxID=754409 RepID=UPI001184ED18|nr:hypothetical protein [Winogradskyella sp. PG-2]